MPRISNSSIIKFIHIEKERMCGNINNIINDPKVFMCESKYILYVKTLGGTEKKGIAHLISGNKLPILFVGSGFSRRYIGSPDWEGLLKEVFFVMGKTEQDFKALKSKVKNDPMNRSLLESMQNYLVRNYLH